MHHHPAHEPPETPAKTAGQRAAFYDVDGTLIKTNIVHAFAWYARNQPTLSGSARKTAVARLRRPVTLALRQEG